jgi:hypothetical protein
MQVSPRSLSALLAALTAAAAFAAPAGAATLTLGSDLKADATITESHGADTIFWPTSIRASSPVMPEDGQIVSVKIKGTVLKEKGAANPATLIHFQSLIPQDNGDMQIWLSSQGFDLPVDQPNTISTFEPENLCVKKGGSVGFNEIGGFMYGGSLTAPLDPKHYLSGAPYQVFGAVRDSITARYTADQGTNNGTTISSSTPNQAPGAPVGTTKQGEELLMQYVVATGQDRSEPCGGPRRHPDGTLVDVAPPKSYMKVASSGGKAQRPYVTKDRKFQTGVYCGGPTDCAGTATFIYKKRTIATASFSVPSMKSGRVPMRLSAKDFKTLDKSKFRILTGSYVLTTTFGTFTSPLTLKR